MDRGPQARARPAQPAARHLDLVRGARAGARFSTKDQPADRAGGLVRFLRGQLSRDGEDVIWLSLNRATTNITDVEVLDGRDLGPAARRPQHAWPPGVCERASGLRLPRESHATRGAH